MGGRTMPDLEEWRDAGRFLDVGGRRIFVREEGSGTAVLVLHGFPGSSFDWHGVLPRLATHARVIAFDFLGYGLSEKPFDARYSLFDQADLAASVAAQLGVERCVLVAHDMGDTVAAEMLMREVEGSAGVTVERTILTNGSIFIDMAQLSPGQIALLSMPDEPLADPMPLDAFRPGLAATFSTEHMPSGAEIDAMLDAIRAEDGDRLLPRLIRYVEERRVHQERWTAGLVRHPAPLSALWGEQDPIAVVAMTDRLAELRPDTEVVRWPDVSHWPSHEVPERLADAIAERL